MKETIEKQYPHLPSVGNVPSISSKILFESNLKLFYNEEKCI